MSDEEKSSQEGENIPTITIQSTRFGELEVPENRVITLPSGMIGFPPNQGFIMLDHKPPFSWLQSVDDSALAFVVVDGFEFGEEYQATPPIGDKDIDLTKDDEYALLVIVTVRSNPQDTTANLKAPIFVNLRNMLGVQVIYDNPQLSTRFPLWATEEEGEENPSDSSEEKK